MHDIEHEGYLALCQRVGTTVTRMLAGAHPDAFAKYPLLVPPKLSPLDDLHDVVLSLMHRSITEQTTDYAAALEALFKRNADDIKQTSFVENWEEYKLTIETACNASRCKSRSWSLVDTRASPISMATYPINHENSV